MAKKKLRNKEIEARAIAIVRDERQRWEVATAFVTDRVAFKMRQLIRIFRKNYFGIFDQPKDPITGQEKVWYPLTEINVEAVVKNIDLDQKDLNFRSKTPDGEEVTELTRAYVKDRLGKMYFGEKLDLFEKHLAIDGTAVWKTFEVDGKLVVRLVDLLNVFIDPTSPSIQEAYRFTERSFMFPEEIKAMTGWMNTEDADVNVPMGLPRTDPYFQNRITANSNVKEWDVYELWGKIPKSLITGLIADEGIEVEGHIVVSGLDSGTQDGARVHLIELNTKTDAEGNFLKPYEECWYSRVPNRWYGRGVAEKLLTLQVYANIILNVRINRSRISQLGLFKIKKNSGITPQMLSRLPVNGAIVLNDMADFEQLVVQEAGATSYKDEDVINSISERLTNAFEIVTGEALPSSTPATNAAIQNQNAKSGFAMTKDAIGFFLERWMDRHALPILAKELNSQDIVRITADADGFSALVNKVVEHQALQALNESFARGYVPSAAELQAAMDQARTSLAKSDLFVKRLRTVIADQLETEVYVTNEKMDVGVTIQNLINMLNAAPEYRDAIIKQTFDLLGLDIPKASQPQLPPGPQQGQGQLQAPQLPGQQQQQMTTNALTRVA